jgi:hypothetical protein
MVIYILFFSYFKLIIFLPIFIKFKYINFSFSKIKKSNISFLNNNFETNKLMKKIFLNELKIY